MGTSWRRLLAAVIGWCAVLSIGVSPVGAHPLGNTSVNVYERIEVAPDSIHIRYVLDVSEIPSVKEKEFADTNDDGIVDQAESDAYLDGLWVYVAPKLILVIDDTPVLLTPVSQTLSFPPGQGGLTLMRAVYDVTAALPAGSARSQVDATLTETTFDGVPGWHEMIVRGSAGASIITSDVPTTDRTDELTIYPPDAFANPMSVRQANFSYALDAGIASSSPGAIASPTPTFASSGPVPGSGRPDDPLVALVGPEVSLFAALAAVGIAIGLGAFHALSPGHGKTLVAAYLIGTRANIRQALGLGLTVAITHTAGVFVLGVATYVATAWIVPDRIVRLLSVATGVLVLMLGGILVWRAWRARSAAAAHGHSHDHGHDHGFGHRHEGGRSKQRNRRRGGPIATAVVATEVEAPTLRRRDVAALGIVGGLIPSGSALLLLLSSVALGQTALGVVLILAFGIGMALVLTGISTGVVLMRSSPLMGWERWRDPRLARLAAIIPAASGVVVIAFGVILTYDALRTLR